MHMTSCSLADSVKCSSLFVSSFILCLIPTASFTYQVYTAINILATDVIIWCYLLQYDTYFELILHCYNYHSSVHWSSKFLIFQRHGFKKMEMAHPALKDCTGDYKLKYVSSSDQHLRVAV